MSLESTVGSGYSLHISSSRGNLRACEMLAFPSLRHKHALCFQVVKAAPKWCPSLSGGWPGNSCPNTKLDSRAVKVLRTSFPIIAAISTYPTSSLSLRIPSTQNPAGRSSRQEPESDPEEERSGRKPPKRLGWTTGQPRQMRDNFRWDTLSEFCSFRLFILFLLFCNA